MVWSYSVFDEKAKMRSGFDIESEPEYHYMNRCSKKEKKVENYLVSL